MKTRLLPLLGLTMVLVMASGGPLPSAQAGPAAPPEVSLPVAESVTISELIEALKSSQVSVTYPFAEPAVERVGEYDRVVVPGLQSHGEPGAPVLPFKTARILLPYGTVLSDIEIVADDENALEGSYTVEPGQELLPTGFASADAGTPPDPAIYESSGQFPGKLYSLLSVQRLTGYTVLLLNLHPVQYVPQTGEITYYQSLTVNVKAAYPARTAATPPSLLRAVPEDEVRVRQMVDNPQTLDTYVGALDAASKAVPMASPLVDEGDPHDYIIITSDILSDTLQTLADWKAGKGLAARVFTTQEITSTYSGDDDPERIRNFIVDAYTTWADTDHPLQYVLLGGDDEVVPIRTIRVQYGGYVAPKMPVDLYYGGLDGDWDADGDGDYGEPAGLGAAGEEVDFFAEVYVGRMTVETITETMHIVSKTLAYEQNPTADYLDRALWLGNKLKDSPLTWGGDSKDLVSNLIPQYNVTPLYQRDGTYSTDGVINNMNAGVHLVNFDGHGNYNCCPLQLLQVDALANDDYFLFYNLGCTTAGFDQAKSGDAEAVAEHYIFTEHAAFAYIGNTRFGWFLPGSTNGPGNILDRLFFDYAVNTDNHNVGKALQLAKEDYYPGHRWSILTLHLLGDPETSVVTDLPVPVANISAPKGGSTIKRGVDVVGTARAGDAPGATFDHYVVEYGAGKSPSSWTQIGLTSTVPVTDDLLAVWDTTVLPDGTYTLRLTVDDGAGETSSHRHILHTDNVYITSPTEGTLVRGGDLLTVTGSALGTDFQNYVLEYDRGGSPGSWTFIFSATVPVTDSVLATWNLSSLTVADDYTIRLIRNGAAHVSTEQVTVYIDPLWQAGWPQSAYYRFVAPSIAAGDIDGDGDLELVATSSGSYSSYVHAWHHDGTPVTGWSQWLSGEWASAPALADLDRDGDLEIVVGAYDNKVYAWHHEIDPRTGQPELVSGWPKETGGEVFASPAVADLDGDGILEIVAAALDGQVYAWRYDGTDVTGWPQATGGQLHASPALGDLDGDEGMEIVATRGGLVYAWHHDGTSVTGWPITATTTITEGVPSPALGDINDDGDMEIVAAVGDQVYAWHHDASVVASWPVTASGTITSSPALGDLDGDDDLEIVVGSDQVHAWHDDGTPVAGWPMTVTQHTNSSPVLGDITGDGEIDVVIGAGDEDEHIYAWHRDGTTVADWPRWVPAFEGSGAHLERLASPIITDLDQDGDLEVAIGAESYVFVFDLAATYSVTDTEWAMFQHDLWLTGWYTSSLPNMPPFVRDVQVNPGFVVPGDMVTVTARVTDEDGVASVTAEIESPDETVLAALTLYDDGGHGDGAAGDDVYGNTWTTLLTKQNYVVDIAAADVLSKPCTHDNIADFTTQDAPYVQYHSHTINREDLNPDGIANPGELVEGSLTLENIGVLIAPGVTATVSTDDVHIWWYTPNPISFGDIYTGGTATSGAYDFSFQISNSCPHSHTVTFDLTIYDTLGNTWADSFDVTVLDKVGPQIWGADAQPRLVTPGEPVTITAFVEDSSGVSSVQAVIESPDETPITTLTLYDDGVHGDWGPDDGTYGNAWTTTPGQQRIHEVDFATEDMLSNTRTYDNLTSFTTQPFGKTANVLLVADGGWSSSSGFRPYYAAALDDISVPHDLWDYYFYGQITTTLQLYTDGAVLWAVPDWGDVSNSMTQDRLQSYLDAGGRLFISGQNIAEFSKWWSTDFMTDCLHAQHTHNVTDSLTLGGVPGDPIGDGLQFGISGGDGADNQVSPDGITPLAPATTVFTYSGSSTEARGGIKVISGTAKVAYFSFGFEAINNASDRAAVMERVLTWLLGALPPQADFTAEPTSGVAPLTVVFTNTSTGGYASSLWSFGDGITSTLESPTHTYTAAGAFTVTLTVNGGGGSHTQTKPTYILVQEKHSAYLPLIMRNFAP
jgi:PKD repeat protein